MKKIFFSASTFAIAEYYENYNDIINNIEKAKAKIVIDWTKDWKSFQKTGKKTDTTKNKNTEILKNINWSKFLNEHTEAIKNCDALIAEVSEPTTSVGYQIFYAASHKKPILALCSNKIKDTTQIKSIINLDNPLLTFRKYTKNNLFHIVNNFINEKERRLLKFNFLVNEEIEDYLNWLEKNSKSNSKSELLREKIINKIIVNDQQYQSYIKNIK